MENLELVELKREELQEIEGGNCECSSAVKAIGAAVAGVANYWDKFSYAWSRIHAI